MHIRINGYNNQLILEMIDLIDRKHGTPFIDYTSLNVAILKHID